MWNIDIQMLEDQMTLTQAQYLRKAQKEIQVLKKQEDEIYGRACKHLKTKDARSFLFSYLFNKEFTAKGVLKYLNTETE
jgi:hypothetical protein